MAKKGKEYIGVFSIANGDERVIDRTGTFEATSKNKAMVLLRDHVAIFCTEQKYDQAKIRLWLVPLADPHGKMKFSYADPVKIEEPAA